MNAKHPIQPVVLDNDGTVRFKRNAIVRDLLDIARKHGVGLNELAERDYSGDDWTQLAQLIGYSVVGASELSYFDPDVLDEADEAVERLLAVKKQ